MLSDGLRLFLSYLIGTILLREATCVIGNFSSPADGPDGIDPELFSIKLCILPSEKYSWVLTSPHA